MNMGGCWVCKISYYYTYNFLIRKLKCLCKPNGLSKEPEKFEFFAIELLFPGHLKIYA